MADLASNLFLRELAKTDLDKERARRDQDRQRQEQAATSQAVMDLSTRAEDAREKAFQRNLATAKLQSEHSARLGKERPEYKSAALQESADTGYGAGEVRVKEELTAAERKQAIEKLRAMEQMKRAEYSKGQDALRSAASDKERMSRDALNNKARAEQNVLDNRTQKYGIDVIDKRARDLFREPGTTPTAASRNRQESAKVMSDALRSIREGATTGEVQGDKRVIDFEKFLSPEAKNQMAAYREKAMIGTGALNKEELADYQRRQDFIAKVDLVKAQKMKELIGAGQTTAEAERTVNALISYDMNAQEFRAALRAMEMMTNVEGGSGSESEFVEAPPPEDMSVMGKAGSEYSRAKKTLKKVPLVGDWAADLIFDLNR